MRYLNHLNAVILTLCLWTLNILAEDEDYFKYVMFLTSQPFAMLVIPEIFTHWFVEEFSGPILSDHSS